MHELVEKVLGIAAVDEHAVHPEILRSDRRVEIGPLRMGRVGWRVDRARTDVAEAAGHADPVGPHEVRILIVVRVGVIALGVPLVLRRLVEVGVREQAQADDAGRGAEGGADRQARAVLEGRPAGADLDPWIFALVLERIGRAVRAADIEPEAEPLRIGTGRLFEARLVERAEPAPARVAVASLAVAIGLARMRGDDLEEIEGGEAVPGHLVPEAVVAAGPHEPHVAALDLVRRERDAVVHGVEEVLAGLRQRRLGPTGALGLIDRRGRRKGGNGRDRQGPCDEGPCEQKAFCDRSP